MARFCAFRERAKSEVIQKLRNLPLSVQDREYVVDRLVAEGFLDEVRYAAAFVNDKFRLNKWGPVKIYHALKARQVDAGAIEQALSKLDSTSVEELALELARQKKALLPEITAQNEKIARFLLQRGFQPEMAWNVIKGLG